jgi:hypothetical protein
MGKLPCNYPGQDSEAVFPKILLNRFQLGVNFACTVVQH